MILDSSAVLAILRGEPEGTICATAIEAAGVCRISAGTYLEAAIIADADGDATIRRGFDDLITAAGVIVEPVTVEQAYAARDAYRDFGRGTGHPARLNYGDCFAYALAKTTGEPLLFKGNDFTHTDIQPAVVFD